MPNEASNPTYIIQISIYHSSGFLIADHIIEVAAEILQLWQGSQPHHELVLQINHANNTNQL
jgi:hypothetical protein